MPRRQLNLLTLLSLVVSGSLPGCSRHYTPYDVFDRHPKLVALRRLLGSEAHKRLTGGASSVYHCVSVEPHMDAGNPGFTTSSGSGPMSGYSYRFYCSTRTIGRANTATGVVVARYPDGRTEMEDEVYFWEEGRWLTYFEWLRRHHPKEWEAFQVAMQTIEKQHLARQAPATVPSTAPVTRP